MDDLFVFRKFMMDEQTDATETYHRAAIDKLQTLFPDKRITEYDEFTIGVETDSLYSETGTDTYELGTVDNEILALRNTRDNNVITFRI